MFYTQNRIDDLLTEMNTMYNDKFFLNRRKDNLIKYNTETDDSGVTLTMEVPGYNNNLIDVTVEGKTLVVEGKSNSGNLDGFKEKFSLGDKFDGVDVEATIVDGILTVSVPYVESVKPRKVKVKVG